VTELPLDLGDGTVLRTATLADVDAVATLAARLIHPQADGRLNPRIAARARDLMSGRHPTASVGTVLVVEDPRAGRIVSTLSVIPQTWAYEGIPFGVAGIEFVATEPAYRRRGYMRRQFAVAHRWCAERDWPVAAIIGIPWYYRRFGYHRCLDIGGWRTGEPPGGPPAGGPGYTLRPATVADLPFCARLADAARSRSLLTCVRDEAAWRYELDGRDPLSVFHRSLAIVAHGDSERRAGFVAYTLRGDARTVHVDTLELAAVVEVTTDVVEAVARAVVRHTGRARLSIGLDEGAPLPVWLDQTQPPATIYLRVADPVALLRRIAPALERRLARSPLAGYDGEARINWYEGAARLTINDGRVTAVEGLAARDHDLLDEAAPYDLRIPPAALAHLIAGHRSLADLEQADADCIVGPGSARALLAALFPSRGSQVWVLG